MSSGQLVDLGNRTKNRQKTNNKSKKTEARKKKKRENATGSGAKRTCSLRATVCRGGGGKVDHAERATLGLVIQARHVAWTARDWSHGAITAAYRGRHAPLAPWDME